MADENKVTIQTVTVPTEAPAVDTALVVRSVVYLIALANFIAPHVGLNFHMNAQEDLIYNIISDLFLVGSFVHAYWKNNNVTKASRIFAEVVKQINVFADRNPVADTPAPAVEAPQAPVEAPAQPATEAPVADQNTNQTK